MTLLEVCLALKNNQELFSRRNVPLKFSRIKWKIMQMKFYFLVRNLTL